MTSQEFVSKLKDIVALPTRYYSVSGCDWAKWNGSTWNFDCVILIKAILWGWNANKTANHGGAIYASNGVYDDDANQIINRCKNVSSNFSNLEVGELLWMQGHVGVYVGNGQVIECTAAWDKKVLYSNVDGNGVRSKNGKINGSWLKHGKLSYIEYENTSNASSSLITISKIQNEFNEMFGNVVGTIAVDNSAGPDTRKHLIMALQYEMNKQYNSNLVIDGSFGPATKRAFLDLKQGCHGNITWLCQAMFYIKGYNPNGLDKSYGPGMADCVLKFQINNGLKQDKILGMNTAYKLFN